MRYLFYIFLLSLLPTNVLAAITFTDGKWETTFDCTPMAYPSSMVCDGVSGWGSGTTGFMTTYPTAITPDANNSAGNGGNGIRFFDGDGTNISSAPANVNFPSKQSEIWVRWYERWQSGYKWAYDYAGTHYSPGYIKQLYFDDSELVGMSSGDNLYLSNQGAGYPNANPFGWKDIFPTNHGLSDGRWIAFEVHMKYNTTGQSDGIGKIWVDGVLKAARSNVNWGSAEGWTTFHFDSNQNQPDNANGPIGLPYGYTDYDDMVIYNTTPPALDSYGNAYIGQLGIPVGDSTKPTTSTNKPSARYTAAQSVTLACTDNVACTATKYCYGVGCKPTTTYSTPFPVLKNLASQTYCVSSTDGTNIEVPKCFDLKKQRRK